MAAYAATIAPPKAMFAMNLWMLIGIQSGFWIASMSVTPVASGVAPSVGLIMKVTQAFATHMIPVPMTFNMIPSRMWTHLSLPFIASQP